MKLVLISVLCNLIFLMIDSTKCKRFTLALILSFSPPPLPPPPGLKLVVSNDLCTKLF